MLYTFMLGNRGMGNVEWGTGNKERGTRNGERGTGNAGLGESRFNKVDLS